MTKTEAERKDDKVREALVLVHEAAIIDDDRAAIAELERFARKFELELV